MLATMLSVSAFVVWLLYFSPRPPAPSTDPSSAASTATPSARPDSAAAHAASSPSPSTGDEPVSALPEAIVGGVERSVRIRSELIDVVLTSQGGVARSWTLLRYRTSATRFGESTEPIQMIPPRDDDAAR